MATSMVSNSLTLETDVMTVSRFVRSPEKMLDHLIASHKDDLVPGGAERVRGAINLATSPTAADVARKFFNYLATPHGSKVIRPNIQIDESKTPLERVVEKLPFKASSVSNVAADLQLEVGHEPTTGEMAAAVLDRVGYGQTTVSSSSPRQFREHLIPDFQPSLPAGEVRLKKVLDERFSDVLPEHARANMARAAGAEMMNTPDRDLVPRIARSLTISGLVDRYNPGGQPLEKDDPRLTERATVESKEAPRGATHNSLAY